MTKFFTHVGAYVSVTLTGLLVALAGAFRTRTANRRGANFIEYAMLAVIAIGIGIVFRSQLSGVFNGVLTQIKEGLGV